MADLFIDVVGVVPTGVQVHVDLTAAQVASLRGPVGLGTWGWRHDGPVWKMEAGMGHSRARNTFRAVDKGYFSGANAERSGVTDPARPGARMASHD